MRSRLILATLLSMVASLFPATSHAADDRVFFYSKQDTSTPAEINANFDLTSIQVALTTEDTIQFYALLLAGVDSTKLVGEAYLGIGVNTDGKTGSEFLFTSDGIEYFGSSKSELKVFDIRSGEAIEVTNCDGKSWITDKEDAIAFEILASCLNAPNGASAIGFASDGKEQDVAPENSNDFKFKTSYMSTKSCTAKTKDTKFTFRTTQYICNQKNGKWSWVDYGPIAAAKAKYLTEKAFYKCGLHVNILGAVLSDKGKTLELDGVYKYLVSDSQFACVMSTLGMPSSVKSKLSMTRALDGIQNAKFGKISADWSYHPDDGLSITFTYN